MKRSPKSNYNHEEIDDPLLKQLQRLEEEWDCIKQSISRSNRRNSATVSVTIDNRLFQMYDKSPKELMSLLQHENSPSEDEFSNSRHHDRVAVEIIKDREADYDNGRFRGRRLFEESEVDSDDDGGKHGDSSDMEEESEVCTEFSYKASENHNGKNYTQLKDSPPSGVAERDVPLLTVKRSGGGSGCSGRRWMICVVIMLFALGIFAFKCSGEDEQILVPT
ncbi:hypothetical protein LXL04_031952 [Taraxacum kok-saghyz]